jgi:hypothetical protein
MYAVKMKTLLSQARLPFIGQGIQCWNPPEREKYLSK